MIDPVPIIRESESLAELAGQINAAHAAGERASWKGLDYFRQAGESLLKAKAKCGHGKWLTWLGKNVRCSERESQRYMALAKNDTVADLQTAWEILTGRDETSTPHVSRNSGENEWYTPAEYVVAARVVLGGIDLDPASSDIAQATVQATTFYTAADDGLAKAWRGSVFLNPPYASDLVEKFVGKLCHHVQAGDVPAAILLVNNATETRWFQEALSACSAICFPASRIKFLKDDGETGAPLQGQAVLYFGKSVDKFFKNFGGFGLLCTRAWESLNETLP